MPNNEQEIGAIFPVSGLDVTCEYGRQPEDTSADAQNVRSFDTTGKRARGGSRPGLSKHINETVVGANLIQHLNILVDPQQPALLADNDPTFADPTTDSGGLVNPGRLIRLGGSGLSPKGNDGGGGGGNDPIAWVQQNGGFTHDSGPSDVFDMELLSAPVADRTILIFLATAENGPLGGSAPGPSSVEIETSDGRPFIQVGSYHSWAVDDNTPGFFPQRITLSVWRIVSDGAPEGAIFNAVADSTLENAFYLAFEYRGIATSSPVSDSDGSSTDSDTTTYSCGSIDTTTLNGAAFLFVVRWQLGVTTSFSLPDGFVQPFNGIGGVVIATNGVVVAHKLLLSSAPGGISVDAVDVPRPGGGISFAVND